MRLVFCGSPAPSARVLEAIVDAGHEVCLVVTAPDRRRGRGSATSPTPVASVATAHSIPISHDVDDVVSVGADLGVVVAFGRLIPTRVLDAVPMVNVHYSLLPRWRGAAPVERAILAGDDHSGVCLMEVVPELDAGGVYARTSVPVGDRTAAELLTDLTEAGIALVLDALTTGLGEPVAQEGEVTYAHKMTPQDRRIDWSAPAEVIARVVRVGAAWTTWRGERVGVVAGDITAGGYVPTVVRPSGRGDMAAADFWRGARADDGEWFE